MYNDKKSNLDKYHQNIRFLAIEMFKVFKGISPQIVKEIFQFRDAMPYQLRKQTNFQIPSAHSAVNGTESIRFLGIKICEILPHETKEVSCEFGHIY